jgi:hypothetical protein
MVEFPCQLLLIFRSLFKSRARLEAEIIVLRQQLNVRGRRKRIRLRNWDRFVFVGLYRFFPSMLSAITIVKPETVIGWHRDGFRAYWRWKPRRRAGRPMIGRLSNLKAAVPLHFAHYNFVRIHPSLRVTPAMAAGASEWFIEELIDIAIDGEMVTGWFTMIEEKLAVPFETMVLGVSVNRRGHPPEQGRPNRCHLLTWARSAAPPILDLPLPSPPPRSRA